MSGCSCISDARALGSTPVEDMELTTHTQVLKVAAPISMRKLHSATIEIVADVTR